MTFADALEEINEWIVANGNNEITADVLRPVLQAMLEACSDTTGDLDNLSTDDKSNLVAAINELYANSPSVPKRIVRYHFGTEDPNLSPPPVFGPADFYIRDSGGHGIFDFLYQYNPVTDTWRDVLLNSTPSTSGGFSKVQEWDGVNPIEVVLDYSGTVTNLNTNKTIAYTVDGTELTPGAGAFSGDVLLLTEY